jgi:hypothetical protein
MTMQVQVQFTTVITHTVTVDDDGEFGIEHEVHINAGDATPLGVEALGAIVHNGARALVKAIDNDEAKITYAEVTDEKADGSAVKQDLYPIDPNEDDAEMNEPF